METNETKPTLDECLVGIREVCKESDFSEDELLHRARILYLMNRLDFFNEMTVLLDEINYNKKIAVENFKKEMAENNGKKT